MADLTLKEFEARVAALGAGGLIKALAKGGKIVSERAGNESKILATTRLRVRSGLLRGSIAGLLEVKAPQLLIGVQAGGTRGPGGEVVKYARIQERGGTVRPKRSKYLAIPVGPARTGAGVSKNLSPRDVPGLAFAQSRKGQPLLLNSLTGQVWFVLRRQVKIKPKWYLRDGLKKAARTMPPLMTGIVTREVVDGPRG